MAKVLLVNGSPRANGCTATALEEMIKAFAYAKEKYGYPVMEDDAFTSFPDSK